MATRINTTKAPGRKKADQVACDYCGLFSLCNPLESAGQQLPGAEMPVDRHRPLRAGDVLFAEGQPFSALFAITTGAIKLVSQSVREGELVVGFVLPGETVGQAGIYPQRYPCSAIALEDSRICELPYHSLTETAVRLPNLQGNVQSMLHKENFDQHRQFAMLMARKNAEQRLSAFLLNLTLRRRERGLPTDEFQLPMSRDDIANFLGLRKETLSRLFTKLHQSGAIAVRSKHIRLLDIEGLHESSGLPAQMI